MRPDSSWIAGVRAGALFFVCTGFLPPLPSDNDAIGEVSTLGGAIRLDRQGGTVFMATSYGLETFDVTDPTSPTAGGALTTPGNALDVDVHGDYCYVADESTGVLVYDVSSPLSPTYVGLVTDGGNDAAGVFADDDYLIVFRLSDGMKVLDLAANPSDPPLLGSYFVLGTQYHNDGIRIGNTVVVGDGVKGPSVFDVSDPTDPQLVAQGLGLDSFAVTTIGRTIFSASPQYGLESYDATPPLSSPLPALDDWQSTAAFSFNLDIDSFTDNQGNDYIAITDTALGCLIFDANDPSDLGIPIETFAESTGAFGVRFARSRVLVAAGSGGLRIYEL
jgi:hypothetical protein